MKSVKIETKNKNQNLGDKSGDLWDDWSPLSLYQVKAKNFLKIPFVREMLIDALKSFGKSDNK